jgi:hypothetical protein
MIQNVITAITTYHLQLSTTLQCQSRQQSINSMTFTRSINGRPMTKPNEINSSRSRLRWMTIMRSMPSSKHYPTDFPVLLDLTPGALW